MAEAPPPLPEPGEPLDRERLLRMFRSAPVSALFQATLAFRDGGGGGATVELPPRKEFCQALEVVHGAVITFAADSAAWFTAADAAGRMVLTSDFNIRLLEPVRGTDGLRATGEVVKGGSTLVVVRGRVFASPGDRLVAEGLWSHVVLDSRRAQGS